MTLEMLLPDLYYHQILQMKDACSVKENITAQKVKTWLPVFNPFKTEAIII